MEVIETGPLYCPKEHKTVLDPGEDECSGKMANTINWTCRRCLKIPDTAESRAEIESNEESKTSTSPCGICMRPCDSHMTRHR